MSGPQRLVTIVGARPQFIKAFALSRELSSAPDFEEVLVHTGQHYDAKMSSVFFEELGISEPKYRFKVKETRQGAATAQMLSAIEAALLEERPDAAIVFGDTNSTLAGALAAAKLHIPLVHVEAGMRSFNREMPEEINRIVTDHIGDIHFCSTRRAVQNLAREGIIERVHRIGDLMYDTTVLATQIAAKRSRILERLSLTPKAYAVATVHRAGNTDDRQTLSRIFDFIAEQSRRIPIVFPIHPRTASAAQAYGLDASRTGATVIEPVGYLDMCQLVHHASAVLTDSGGLQKEAYFHRVPCVTLRAETEWVETTEAGWNKLWTSGEYRERTEISEIGAELAAPKIVHLLREELRN